VTRIGLFLIVVAVDVALSFYISRFRKDSNFGTARFPGVSRFRLPPLTQMELLEKDSYTADGQKLLPWLVIASVATLGVAVALVFL
jgi:hypothetical protein